MAKKAATANKARTTNAPDPATVSDETVVYVDKDGNQLDDGEQATNGARILRGDDADRYLAGEALPEYGIGALEDDDDTGAPQTAAGVETKGGDA